MDETTVLIEHAQAGDKEALEVLTRQNSGLVHFIVKRFEHRGVESEDLFQIGCMGLVKSIKRFDTSLGLQFSTYAVPLITGEIKRFLRDDGPVKISRTIKENRSLVLQAREELLEETGREPNLEELAIKTGLEKEDILLALDATAQVESLNMPKPGEEEGERMDALADCKDPYEEFLNRRVLEELLGQLETGEKKLIYLRYYQNLTQSQTAKVLGTNQVQVSRREKKILERLRKKL